RLMFEYEQVSWLAPKPCSTKITQLIEDQVQQRGFSYTRMPSGAGHDTQFLAEVTEAGLIFIPSVNGVSHAPDEWSHWHDVEAGTNVLLDTIIATAATDLSQQSSGKTGKKSK